MVTPTTDAATGWGGYSNQVISRLREEYEVTVINNVPDVMNFLTRPYKLPSTVAQIRSTLHRMDIDVVFTLASFPYSVATYLATRGLDIPYFVSCHATYAVAPLYNSLSAPVARLAFKNAARLFPVSTFTADRIRDIIPDLENIQVAPNGIDVDDFEPAEPFNLDHEVILTVGAFKPRKGQDIAVRAFARIASERPELEHHLIGKNPEKLNYTKKVKRTVRQLGIEDRVHFEGFVNEKELERWYASAKLFLLTPQYIDHHFEGNPLVYHEAFRYGVPAVGTERSGAEQAISHGESGLCVENDVEAIAEAMFEIVCEESRYEQFCAGASEWAHRNTWDNCVDIIIEEVEKCV